MKQGGSDRWQRGARSFWKVLKDYELLELGYTGPNYTWMNSREGAAIILERIDRGLCNQGLVHLFPKAVVEHLVRRNSDHAPILIKLQGIRSMPSSKKPFKYLMAWQSHENFPLFFQEIWGGPEENIQTKLQILEEKAMIWNK